jgi:exosortase
MEAIVIRKHIFFAVLSALLMVYLSGAVFIGWFSSLLQRTSTTMAVWLFALSGVPVWREGFVLHTVNNVSVFVSKDCGGIRSTLAMLILAVVATYLYLRTPWRQAAFIIVAVVLTIFKNALRIVTLALLGAYVNPEFLYGRLHSESAVIFFLLSMVLLIPYLWLLHRGEATTTPTQSALSQGNA